MGDVFNSLRHDSLFCSFPAGGVSEVKDQYPAYGPVEVWVDTSTRAKISP
ncbi:unnamed protein product [Staurois parvus]|uniref:Uncharacterized protein n=1 Tax=Staurois parvus TaxID=386267 RepID=A0ABN9DXT9_9NEOB|nr:unnamed protein product [Staurois parvus]